MARRRRKRQKEKRSPALAWMTFGLMIGIGLSVGIYVLFGLEGGLGQPSQRSAREIQAPRSEPPTAVSAVQTRADQPAEATAEAGAGAGAGTQAAGAAPAESAAPEPERFDFYTALPEHEVVVPEIQSAAASRTAPESVAEPGRYVLQAGSFLTAADAESQRARLALLGIESRIQVVTVDQYVYHRVRVGPIGDLAQFNRYRQQLFEADIDTMTIRLID